MACLHKPLLLLHCDAVDTGPAALPLLQSVVACILHRGAQPSCFYARVALTSKSMLMAVGQKLLAHSKMHPILFLEHCLLPRRSPAWLCVIRAIVFGHDVIPPACCRAAPASAGGALSAFLRRYQQSFRTKLAPAREVTPDGRFTFHIVTRWLVRGPNVAASFRERAQRTGGELAMHKFICMRDAREALEFLQRWAHAQRLSHGPDATCMMECGPACAAQPRKWIIDLDGKVEDLRSMGFLAGEDAPCLEEVNMCLSCWVAASPL